MPEVAEKQDVVTFYSFADGKPCSQRIRISGGERFQDTRGQVAELGLEEVQFTALGVLRTSDPKVIATLRKLSANGGNITEDPEIFDKHVLSMEEQNRRTEKKNKDLLEENSRLRSQLQERGSREREKKTA